MHALRFFRRRAVLAALVVAIAVGLAGAEGAIAALPSQTSATPRAVTRSGTVIGSVQDQVEVFRGIPYAAPPVGELRWRAPQLAPAWKGARPALAFGADCMQDTKTNPLPPGHAVPASEDCLYLNVWRPAGTKAGERLPVMVWIHGGGFIMGSGAMSTYDGSALARRGAIIVTINYRLGRFGNFTTPALYEQQVKFGEPAANFWLMDQIAALRWVRDNAAGFGGDPDRVTLIGESAGAVSVATLLAVKPALGLFRQAIMQSGSPRRILTPLAQSQQAGLSWALSKGIADDDPAALRRLSTQIVLDAPVTAVSEPVEDGDLLCEPPSATFARGQAAKVPVLIGANDWEESLLRWMPDALPALAARLGAHRAEGLRLYDAARIGENAALSRMWGDAAMVEPARQTARLALAAGGPVWLYHFSYVPEALRATRPGAGHGDEIEFVFANPNAQSGWTQDDQAMADAMAARWIAFAKTGFPGVVESPAWPQLTREEDILLAFTNSGQRIVREYKKAQLDFLRDRLGRGSLYGDK
ncbi:carboxylesterase/lipase family protein [Novosphingobium soli]|uniref:Carboxylic ester hydrolase n=1 Tax=Novosphingobium soli TaxID=574956 RepID=A0ABV6CZE7_9SPHN